MICPENPYFSAWVFVIAFFSLVSGITNAYCGAFQVNILRDLAEGKEVDIGLITIYFLTELIMFIDIFILFFVEYLDEDRKSVAEFTKIAWRYLKG